MSQTSTMAQTSGVFVLDGSPKEKNAFFAGRTEVYVDGDRLKVVEWPEETEDPSLTLATYYLGPGLLKSLRGMVNVWPSFLNRINLLPGRKSIPLVNLNCRPHFLDCIKKRSCHVDLGAPMSSGTCRLHRLMLPCLRLAEHWNSRLPPTQKSPYSQGMNFWTDFESHRQIGLHCTKPNRSPAPRCHLNP